MDTGGGCHGCGLHVDRVGCISLSQFCFLLRAGYGDEAYEYAVAGRAFDFEAAAIASVDYNGWLENIAGAQGWIERAGEANRLQAMGMVKRDYGFGGATRGFSADATAYEDHVVALEEREFMALVVKVDTAAGFYETGNFALKSGYDGEFAGGGIHFPIVVPLRLEPLLDFDEALTARLKPRPFKPTQA